MSGNPISKPFGGSGMDLSKAGNILDPIGIFGGGGMNKGAAEAFLDPAGIDSGPNGLNLFGQRKKVTPGGPSNLPTLNGSNAAAGLSGNYAPQFFTSQPTPYAPAPSPGDGMMNFNNMAQQLAGPQYGFGIFAPPPSSVQNNAQSSNLPHGFRQQMLGHGLPFHLTFNRQLP